MGRTHQGLSTCEVWKRYCQWSFCNELKRNNRFDLETWNHFKVKVTDKGSQWVELHQGLSTCEVWKRYCQWSFCNELKRNNRFDLETWNLQVQGHRQRSQLVELIKVYLHVKFERGIVYGHSAMNLKARAKPNCWCRRTDRQMDGTISYDRILHSQSGQKMNIPFIIFVLGIVVKLHFPLVLLVIHFHHFTRIPTIINKIINEIINE